MESWLLRSGFVVFFACSRLLFSNEGHPELNEFGLFYLFYSKLIIKLSASAWPFGCDLLSLRKKPRTLLTDSFLLLVNPQVMLAACFGLGAFNLCLMSRLSSVFPCFVGGLLVLSCLCLIELAYGLFSHSSNFQ